MEVTKHNNLLSIADLTRSDIERLIGSARTLREGRSPLGRRLSFSFIAGLLFFEESTRTRIGFQSAVYRLGGEVCILKETKFKESMSSSESVEDTVRVLDAYTDILCIRHPHDNIFSRIIPLVKKPLINCGNGHDEHPTQALTDLFALRELTGKIDGLSVAIVGDLRHMRAAHSLLLGLSKFSNITVCCISPKPLAMPKKYTSVFRKTSNVLHESAELVLRDYDVVYMAGFPPKTPVRAFGKVVRRKYQINAKTLKSLKKNSVILCPLPRVDEIAKDVDHTPFAKYFEQSELGLYMRMAVIAKFLRQ